MLHHSPDNRNAPYRAALERIAFALFSISRAIGAQTKPTSGKVRFAFGFGLPHPKESNPTMPVQTTLTNEQKITATLNITTDSGKLAKVDGVPTWEVISGNSTVEVAADGMSATLISSDDPGDTQFLIRADANLGEGVEEISDVIELSVTGASAKNLGVSLGTPEVK